MEEEIYLLCFKSISNFVTELSKIFPSNKNLSYYRRIISKASITSTYAIEKHIEAFRKFYQKNEHNIKEMKTPFEFPLIFYSENCFIDMNSVFSSSEIDNDSVQDVWKHLLTIIAIIEPSSGAKKILQQMSTGGNRSTNQQQASPINNEFIGKTMSKMQEITANEQDPQKAIEKVMSSGIVTEMFSTLTQGAGQNGGQIDFQSLIGSISGMMTGLMANPPPSHSPNSSQSPDQLMKELDDEN